MWDDILKRFKDIEIQPRVLPERTLLMLKCLEYKYAKAFIETGAMKFAIPQAGSLTVQLAEMYWKEYMHPKEDWTKIKTDS